MHELPPVRGTGQSRSSPCVGTPRFHALGPGPVTSASPPDLRAYRAFVRALVARYGDRVDYQVWNEPNVTQFYTGNAEHMARMTYILNRAVRTLAPAAVVVAPSFPLRGEGNYSRKWFKRYWTREVNGRPISRLVDVASLSAYPMPDEDPEDGLAITQWARRTVTRLGFNGELWATEINYGANGGAPTAPLPMRGQVSNVVRTLCPPLDLGRGPCVLVLVGYPDPTVNTQRPGRRRQPHAGRHRLRRDRDWILGTRPTGCSITRGVTTCGFRVEGGVRRDSLVDALGEDPSARRSRRGSSQDGPGRRRRRLSRRGRRSASASPRS